MMGIGDSIAVQQAVIRLLAVLTALGEKTLELVERKLDDKG